MKYGICQIRLCVLSLVFTLSACGGGGGSGDNTNSSINNSAISSTESSSSSITESSTATSTESSAESSAINTPDSSSSTATQSSIESSENSTASSTASSVIIVVESSSSRSSENNSSSIESISSSSVESSSSSSVETSLSSSAETSSSSSVESSSSSSVESSSNSSVESSSNSSAESSSSSSAESSSSSSVASSSSSSAETSSSSSAETSSSSSAETSSSSSAESSSSSSAETSSSSSAETSSSSSTETSSSSSAETSSSSSAETSSSSSVESSSSSSAESSSSAPSVDITPNVFSFAIQTEITPSSFAISESITISGINTPVPITIVGGEYSVDDDIFTDTDGSISDGQTIRVRVMAAETGLTTTIATLTIGGVSSDFAVTTQLDITPNVFAFDAQIDAAFATLVESNNVTISGVDEPVSISITGGEYSIDGAGFTPDESIIEAGQTVKVRLVTANSFGATITATLAVGNASADFSVTTIRDTAAPTASVIFPLPVSRTTSNGTLVRGTAQDTENNAITSVMVEGVAATSDDGFATWQAQVPLVLGKTFLDISTQDSEGNTDSNAARIAMTSGTAIENFQRPRAIEFDADNNRVLLIDETLKALISVDLNTNRRIIMSNANVGAGPTFGKPSSVTLDRANRRAFVADIGKKAIIAVDLTTGDRSVFSASPACSLSGVKDKIPLAVAIDNMNNRVLALDCFSAEWGVVAIDLTTGERSRVDHGGGARIDNLTDIAIDNLNGRALITDFGQIGFVGGVQQNSPKVIAVSFATGIRTVFSGVNVNRPVGGGQNDFDSPVSISMDTANNRALVLDANTDGLGALFGVDLTTGFRSVMSGPRDGGGDTGSKVKFSEAIAVTHNTLTNHALVLEATKDRITRIPPGGARQTIGSSVNSATFATPSGLVFDSDKNRVLTVDHVRGALFAINLTTSVATIVSSSPNTSGSTDFGLPFDVALDKNANRALVPDVSKGVLAVDFATGNRSIFSGAGVGSGPTISSPYSIVLDAENNRAFVGTNQSNAKIFSINLTNGARTLLTDSTRGTGPTLSSIASIIMDKDNNRLLAVQAGPTDSATNFIFAVDLTTGNRSIISGGGVGSGTAVRSLDSIVMDKSNNRLLATDNVALTLMAVDLTTGERTLISGKTVGTGTAFGRPGSIAMLENNIALVMDFGALQLFAVDLTTGERVMVAR